MDFTKRLSEQMYPLDNDPPDSVAAGTVTGAYVSMKNYDRAWLVLHVGDMQATATLDCKLRQAKDSSGTSVKDVSGKAITQLTQAGGDGDQVVVIELRAEELDVNGGFEHVNYVITVANAAVELGAILFGAVTHYEPVPTTNYEEIVD